MAAVDEYRKTWRDGKTCVSVYLDTDMVAALDQQAEERTVSRRLLIDRAIRKFLRDLESGD